MNIRRCSLGLAAILLVLSLVACPDPGSDSGDTTLTAGEERTEITGSISFDLRYVPKGAFVMGDIVQSPTLVVTLTKGYWMAETEVTYELWYEVYTWALINGYTFANQGREGDDGDIGAVPTPGNTEPVTTINWRDAMLWCNALSEKQGLTPAYYTDYPQETVIRSVNDNVSLDPADGDINSHDPCGDIGNVKWAADGYRLPTGAEWEYASRYRDGSDWTPGNYASGATAAYTDAGANDLVAWYSANSSSTHPVGQKSANALGINDMSGNVWEWCWEWSWYEWYAAHGYGLLTDPRGPPIWPTHHGGPLPVRLLHGGFWCGNASSLQCAHQWGASSFWENDYIGFRPVRNE